VQHELSFEGLVPPRDRVVLRFDGETGDIVHHAAPELALTLLAREAVDVAPAWIRSALAFRLARISPTAQDELSETILNAGDPRYIDEIAFVVASISPVEADGGLVDLDLLETNAQLIYDLDAVLEYVTVVDVGDPAIDDDYYTTLRYRLAGDDEIELPRDLYYWWVVHPRAVQEYLVNIDPQTGQRELPARGGVHWRSYIAHQDAEPTRSAWLHFLTEHLNLIDTPMLSGWGPSAQGHLTDLQVDPVVLAAEAASGEPMLVLLNFPNGTLTGSRNIFDATVIATTMPLEQAYENGHPDLLENLVPAGAASSRIHGGGYSILVIKDRDPWGVPTVETILTGLGMTFDVITSAEIATTDLSGYVKIIVPSAQPRILYEAMVAATDQINAWLGPPRSDPEVGHERVLQFHGAIDQAQPGDAWCDLTMPGGFSCDSLDSAVDNLELGGYPTFLDTVTQADIVWDGVSYYAAGHEPLETDAHALRRIGYFGAQNLLDRCGEIPAYYSGPDYDCPACDGRALSQSMRSAYAQRILYLHFGNCGETRILLSAAGRTGLVPTAPVGCAIRDHVWNEINLGQGWRHYEIYRSDRWMHVGDHRDERYTTTWSNFWWNAVPRIRGDGYVENATLPYNDETYSIVVTVTDRDGTPVDGARVLVASEHLYADAIVVTMQAWTDQEGRAELVLGTGPDVYLQISSPLGYLPDADHVAIAACAGGTSPLGSCHDSEVPGAVYEVNYSYEDAGVADPQVTPNDTLEGSEILALQLNAGRAVLLGTNATMLNQDHQLEFLEPRDQGVMDLSVVDQENLDLVQAGEPYTALGYWRDVSAVDVHLPVEVGQRDLFIVLSNARSQGHALEVSARISHEVEVPDPDADDGDSGAGCGCRAQGRSPTGSLTLVLLILFTVLRRSRR